MRAVLISIQPKWVFLIIAQKMGWDIGKEKTIEVRKDFPKAVGWNKKVKIYCSKNKKSFAEIPKTYQPLMEKFLGKVIGEFVCDRIDKYNYRLTTYEETPYKGKYISKEELAKTCLPIGEINDYLNGKDGYLWHISDLKIYDKPKELSEFKKSCPYTNGTYCIENKCEYYGSWTGVCRRWVERPPQSWCYVEELQNG